MSKIYSVDWADIVIPTHSILEMVVRGSLSYVALFVILRFLMKRQSSTIGIADILVIVVIADAAQNGFSKEYKSVTESIVLVLTIVFWDFAFNWLGFHVSLFERLLAPLPVPLITGGHLDRRNMRRELITEEELRSHLRQEGLDDFSDVESACVEGNGEISVVKKKRDAGGGSKKKPGA
ncbi:DUF421 domain-containing protein [Bradyrhizobium sp. CCGB12]|uniref:DUF421 domain-containing protein n=1 Tax=Bradyrhizobium sp. CCGB12 TaxID=2949632 RepID=UPI0020B30157|nr:YetF domain-containing protein [Bradyrhizobium sp. CCGB12]MCP3395036.1 DUF421 domain-containing protein [Bradyrhizobium sp. CCGB12]